MKKHVVYILGAGFSAPWGIPVMRDFIDKARVIRRRFIKADTGAYLGAVFGRVLNPAVSLRADRLTFDKLEESHEEFVQQLRGS